ncbi:MAG: hypothetical protein CMH85_10620 [Novosphingobium sp.]|nr:hypothetical protein [Novosphingobium sp.]
MADWSHPAIPAAWLDPAVDADLSAIHDYDALAEEARAAFLRRRAAYPDLVKAGRLTAEDARTDLEGWQAVSRDWRWIAFGEGEPATVATLQARIAVLGTGIARWLDMIAANGGAPTFEEACQGQALAALRWWAQREYRADPQAGHIRDTAAIAHDWRRENGFPTRGAMIAGRTPPHRNPPRSNPPRSLVSSEVETPARSAA